MCSYSEDEYLMISGIQHFEFCPRQWALIHIEQQWAENILTVEGNIMHEKAHDRDLTETRGDLIISRGMPVFSKSLGVTGECDVVEFHRDEKGVPLYGREGSYIAVPVEYKKGKPKEGDEDRLQLVCQAMCLEEMLCCTIDSGYLYYGEPKKRTKVIVDDALRSKVKTDIKQMHQYFRRKHTPDVRSSKKCSSCSVKDICMPKRKKYKSVENYIESRLGDIG